MTRDVTIPAADNREFAATHAADRAGEAIAALQWAARRRSVTVQWMPEDAGCRFEIIRAADGEMLGVVHVARDGKVRLVRRPDE